MKTSFSRISSLLTLSIGILASFNSCKEDAFTSPDLIPTVDNINTFEVNEEDISIAYQVKMMDSFITNDPALPVASAGTLWDDPFFGKVENELFFQVTVPVVGFKFGSTAVIDSAFVSLPYSRIAYGDTASESKYDLHLINDNSFKADPTSVKYYSNSVINIDPTPISSYTGVLYNLNKDTIVYPNKDTAINQLRFKLDAATLAYIKTMDSNDTRNNSEFTKFLNGFCIKTSTTATAAQRKALQYFILEPSNANSNFRKARMEIYYRENDTVKKVVSFPFSKRYSGFYTKTIRDYTGYPASTYSTTGTSMDSILITGRPGFDTDIKLGNLSMIPKSVINLGRLTIKIPKDNTALLPPDLLTITGLDATGKETTLPDYGVSGDNTAYADLAKKFVGGSRQSRKIDGIDYWIYEINIPRSIQKAVYDGSNFLSLRINAFTIYPGASRMVVPAKTSLSNNGVKLSIIYTKI